MHVKPWSRWPRHRRHGHERAGLMEELNMARSRHEALLAQLQLEQRQQEVAEGMARRCAACGLRVGCVCAACWPGVVLGCCGQALVVPRWQRMRRPQGCSTSPSTAPHLRPAAQSLHVLQALNAPATQPAPRPAHPHHTRHPRLAAPAPSGLSRAALYTACAPPPPSPPRTLCALPPRLAWPRGGSRRVRSQPGAPQPRVRLGRGGCAHARTVSCARACWARGCGRQRC